ncbi:DUF1653 domain-containing protein [Brevibacillus laterosporus]|uniref:DUF1653 domain-containing protein n=1 Tax=Brevibacillus laterosporus TaxID=1465 RepID=UPI00191D3563|nr:DUF1653 domain-containing protein [Brevibacillus laterosporus]
MDKPQIGETYRHFKGYYYVIVGYAFCSETQKELVLYQENRFNGRVWARPLEMFVDVHPEHKVKRFEKITT